MNIIGKKVILRAIEEKDLKLLHKWSNDPAINYMLGGWHFPSSLQNLEGWHKKVGKDSLNQRFSVDNHDGDLIGSANLVNINWKDRNAFIGLLIGSKKQQGRGFGFDILMSLMKYSFEELGLERLDTTIIENNDSSVKLFQKCGWKKEGEKNKAYWRRNKFWSQLIYGITKADYNTLNQ